MRVGRQKNRPSDGLHPASSGWVVVVTNGPRSRTIRPTFYRRPPPIGPAAPTVAPGSPDRHRKVLYCYRTSVGLAFRQQRFRRDIRIATAVPWALKPLSHGGPASEQLEIPAAQRAGCCEHETCFGPRAAVFAGAHWAGRGGQKCGGLAARGHWMRVSGQNYPVKNARRCVGGSRRQMCRRLETDSQNSCRRAAMPCGTRAPAPFASSGPTRPRRAEGDLSDGINYRIATGRIQIYAYTSAARFLLSLFSPRHLCDDKFARYEASVRGPGHRTLRRP
jgi:hypothetical protein